MKSLNEYAGCVPDWQVQMAARRIRSWRFRGADFDDALQEVVLALVDHVYDPERWHDVGERQAAMTVIERRLAMIRRAEMRYRQRVDRWREGIGHAGTEEAQAIEIDSSLPLDLAGVLVRLPERSRQVCVGLSQGETLNEIATRLRTSWSAVRREVERIRQELQRAGFGPQKAAHKEAVA